MLCTRRSTGLYTDLHNCAPMGFRLCENSVRLCVYAWLNGVSCASMRAWIMAVIYLVLEVEWSVLHLHTMRA